MYRLVGARNLRVVRCNHLAALVSKVDLFRGRPMIGGLGEILDATAHCDACAGPIAVPALRPAPMEAPANS